MRKLVVAWFVVAALSTPAQAQSPDSAWSDFTRQFDQEITRDGIVGASAVLVRRGQIVARIDRGLADRDLHQRVDARTLFHWASITKTLGAIAILQLVERKRVTLDDPIVRYVPELRRMHDPYRAVETITLRMLLSHSAGFQAPTWPYRGDRPWEPFEPTDWSQLVAMMPYQQLEFRPGSRFGYSNPGYIYLARVVEAVTGDPWEVYVQKNLFAPLGLSSSYFGATPYHLAADRANSYLARRDASGKITLTPLGRDFNPGITIPNGGWNAPLADVAAYMGFLAGSNEPELRRRYEGVLPRRTLEQMWKPVLASDDAAQWIGLGFFVSPPGKPALVFHSGTQAGFKTFFVLNPRTGTAIVAAFNTLGDFAAYKSLFEASGAFLLHYQGL